MSRVAVGNNSLLPLLYFTPLRRGSRVRVVSPGRPDRNPELGSLDVTVEHVSPEAIPGSPCDLLIWDCDERVDHRQLTDSGALLYLDRSADSNRALREAPYYMGLRTRPPASLRRIARSEDDVTWSFLVEPTLDRTRFLVPPGRARSLALDYGSPLRIWLKRHGLFCLQPRDRAAVLAPKGARSLMATLVGEYLGQEFEDGALRSAAQRIYVSATGMMVVRLVWGGTESYLRIPFGPHALARLRRTYAMETLLLDKGIALAPRPLRFVPDAFAPHSIESAVAGSVARPTSHQHIEAALETITGIHRTFGRTLRMDSATFARHVQRKLDLLSVWLRGQFRDLEHLQGVGRDLRAALLGQTVIISLVHGDFHPGNCLFDSNGQVSGLVDWDLGRRHELGVVDPSSYLVHVLRERDGIEFQDAAARSFSQPDDVLRFLRSYHAATRTSPLDVRSVFLLHWVDRVCKHARIGADPTGPWSRQHVAPLLEEYGQPDEVGRGGSNA